jgi:hypothetical protein
MEVSMRRLIPAVIVLAAMGLAEAPLGAQEQRQLFLSLVGPDGEPIRGVRADEVTVLEDGVAGKTLRVEEVEWPSKITVLVDNGQATTNPINPLRTGLQGFLEAIPEGVEVSLITIAPNPRWVVKPTTERQKLVDGIGLITPDENGGMFFDGLAEAAGRIEKDKSDNFPIIVLIASDYGTFWIRDRDYARLQQRIIDNAVTVHMALVSSGTQGVNNVQGYQQTEVGITVTRLSGGRYESLASATRLATLLPEWGALVAKSIRRQRHQYRIAYERPAGAKQAPGIAVSVARSGLGMLSIDGHLPQPE